MPLVYDATTGAPVNASESDAQEGLLQGRYGLDPNAGPMRMRGADGSVYLVKPDNVAGALQTGYSFLSHGEDLARQTVAEERAKGALGSVEAGALSGINQLAFGLPEELASAGETEDQRIAREARDQYHSGARAVGGALGFAGSMLAGWELFKPLEAAGAAAAHALVPAAELAEAGLATRLAAKAVDMGVQGAIASSPSALIQATIGGDPKRAAETLAWGVGLGAILGTAVEGVSALGSYAKDRAVEAMSNPEARAHLDEFANERLLKAAGAERSTLNKLSKDRMGQLGDALGDIVQPGMSRQDIGAAIEAAHAENGARIGKTLDALDSFALGGERAPSIEPGVGERVRAGDPLPHFEADPDRLARVNDYIDYGYLDVNDYLRDPAAFEAAHGPEQARAMADQASALGEDLSSAPRKPGVYHRVTNLPEGSIDRMRETGKMTNESPWFMTSDKGLIGKLQGGDFGDGAGERVQFTIDGAPVDVSGLGRKRPGEAIMPAGSNMRVESMAERDGVTHVKLVQDHYVPGPVKVSPRVDPRIVDAYVTPERLAETVRAAIDGPDLRMPMNRDQSNALDMVLDSIRQLPTNKVGDREVVSFRDAQDFASSLRKRWTSAVSRAQNDGGVKGLETVTALDAMKGAVYTEVRDAIHAAGDAVAVAAGQPKLTGELAAAKAAYSQTAQLEQFARVLDRQNAGNRKIGLTDFMHAGHGPLSSLSTGVGAALGSVAGPGGALVGAGVGKAAGFALDLLAKHWVEDKGLVYLSSLAKRAAKDGPEMLTAVMATEGAKRLQATMRGVGDAVKRMAQQGLARTKAGPSEHMKQLLGDTTGLSHDQQHDALASRLQDLAANPNALAESVGSLSAPIAAASPELGQAYQDQMIRAVQYLSASLPHPPAPAAPFAPDDYRPSRVALLSFRDRAEVAANPMRVMHHVERGTLSDDHLDAIANLYPGVLDAMRQAVAKFHVEHGDVKLPARERASVMRLMGDSPLPVPSDAATMQLVRGAFGPAQAPARKTSGGKIETPDASSAFSGTQGQHLAG